MYVILLMRNDCNHAVYNRLTTHPATYREYGIFRYQIADACCDNCNKYLRIIRWYKLFHWGPWKLMNVSKCTHWKYVIHDELILEQTDIHGENSSFICPGTCVLCDTHLQFRSDNKKQWSVSRTALKDSGEQS